MKLLLITILLMFHTDPTKIGKVNTLKTEAKKSYLSGDYPVAIRQYKQLIDSLQINEDEVKLNLAHAYYHSKDTTNAMATYQSLTASQTNALKSIANQQLGVIKNQQGKLEEALSYFKLAIKADPTNRDARYNYEMVKKKLEEKKKQEQQKQDQQNKENQQNQNKDKQQQNKKEDNKEDKKKSDEKSEQSDEEKKKQEEEKKKQEQQKEQEQKDAKEKKDTPPELSEKLQQMKITEEKAKMLLEAMKNQEIQYLQQNKRKATKPKEKGKPDW
ncbi:MAG: hypothetical protein ACOVOF_11490 [Chryseotalea sp.]